jgi:hypothetical protein
MMTSGSRRAARTLLAVLALTMAACGTRGPRATGNPFDESGAGLPQIRVRVQNQNFYDATVTVLGDNVRRRLGSVGGNSSATFTMAWEFSSGFRVQIDLLAGPSCTSDTIQVNPGDEVEFQIPSDLGTTGYCR